MKVHTLFQAVFVVAGIALSSGASAATDASADSASKHVATPHNHMTEKTGIPAKKAESTKPVKKPAHDHQQTKN